MAVCKQLKFLHKNGVCAETYCQRKHSVCVTLIDETSRLCFIINTAISISLSEAASLPLTTVSILNYISVTIDCHLVNK